MGRNLNVRQKLGLAAALVWLGLAWAARRVGVLPAGRLAILRYGPVSAGQLPDFRRQLRQAKAWGAAARADHVAAGSGSNHFALTFDGPFPGCVAEVLPILIEEATPCAIFVPADGLDAFDGAGPGVGKTLDIIADAMAERGLPRDFVTIAAMASSVADGAPVGAEELSRQLAVLKWALSGAIGREIDLVALPQRAPDRRLAATCEELGFFFAFVNGLHTIDPADPRILRSRIEVSPGDPALVFWASLRGGYDWAPFLMAIRAESRQALGRLRSLLGRLYVKLRRFRQGGAPLFRLRSTSGQPRD